MRVLRWSSLSFQLIGIMLGLTLGLGLIRTWLNRAELESFAREQFESRSIATASAFAAYATDAALTSDLFRLNELIADTRSNNPAVRYILVLDAQGRVRAHSFEQGIPRGLLALHSVDSKARSHLQRAQTEEGAVLDVAVPLFENTGSIRLGMSERALQADLDRHTFNLLGVTFLSLIPVFIAAYSLARVLSRPLESLVGVTRAVAQGDFSRSAPVRGQDEIVALGTAFNAMTGALAQSQAELRASNQQLQQRNDELAARNAFVSAITQSADREDLLQRALTQALALMNLDSGWVLLTHDSAPTVAAAHGITDSQRAALKTADCRCAQASSTSVAHDGATCEILGGCHVCIPLTARERVWGTLHLACRDAACLAPDQLRLLSAMGQQIGLALENFELAETQRRERFRVQLLDRVIEAQEDERKRIARELHDEFAQSLTALIVGLQTLEQAESASAGTRARLSETRGLAARILDQTRKMIFDLRPSVLDDAGLVPALQSFAERTCDAHQLTLDLYVRGARRRLPPQVETALFRIAQEALNNVVKHARAARVTIQIAFEPACVTAVVRDDGRGFDVNGEWRGGAVGLLGMRERAELVGGRLQIESGEGKGTRVRVEIPLRPEHNWK